MSFYATCKAVLARIVLKHTTSGERGADASGQYGAVGQCKKAGIGNGCMDGMYAL